jgi:hypothetical protein
VLDWLDWTWLPCSNGYWDMAKQVWSSEMHQRSSLLGLPTSRHHGLHTEPSNQDDSQLWTRAWESMTQRQS